MLAGLVLTILWIPADEYRAGGGGVKTLEQWQVGRVDSTFARTWLARTIVVVYRWLAKFWDVVYLWLDSLSGGEVAQGRALAAEQAAQQTAGHTAGEEQQS